MEIGSLDEDVTLHVLMRLDSGDDAARAAAVCRSWHKQVVEGRLFRRLCIMKFPELESIQQVSDDLQGPCSDPDSEHLLFCDLYGRLMNGERSKCLFEALGASSTDHASEDIKQTLFPAPKRSSGELSYWSSGGEEDDTVPETLTYRIVTPLCVIDEIRVRPFKAHFQIGYPIYSSSFVRFKFGYQRLKNNVPQYVWTYASKLFAMKQADTLQSFKLARPVVCIGGIFQAEFIGRNQKQEMDQLYYICICHVSVEGRPLWNYDLEMKDGHHSIALKKLSRPRFQPIVEDFLDGVEVEEGDDDEEEEFRWDRIQGLVRLIANGD